MDPRNRPSPALEIHSTERSARTRPMHATRARRLGLIHMARVLVGLLVAVVVAVAVFGGSLLLTPSGQGYRESAALVREVPGGAASLPETEAQLVAFLRHEPHRFTLATWTVGSEDAGFFHGADDLVPVSHAQVVLPLALVSERIADGSLAAGQPLTVPWQLDAPHVEQEREPAPLRPLHTLDEVVRAGASPPTTRRRATPCSTCSVLLRFETAPRGSASRGTRPRRAVGRGRPALGRHRGAPRYRRPDAGSGAGAARPRARHLGTAREPPPPAREGAAADAHGRSGGTRAAPRRVGTTAQLSACAPWPAP